MLPKLLFPALLFLSTALSAQTPAADTTIAGQTLPLLPIETLIAQLQRPANGPAIVHRLAVVLLETARRIGDGAAALVHLPAVHVRLPARKERQIITVCVYSSSGRPIIPGPFKSRKRVVRRC